MNILFRRSISLAALAAITLAAAGCASKATREARYRASAKSYMDQQSYPEAIIQYRNAAALAPTDAELQFELGQAYSKNQQFQDAFASLTRAVRLRPDYPEAQVALGEFYMVAKQFNQATAAAQAVLAKHPDNVSAVELASNIAATQGHFADGMAKLQAALAANPKDVSLHLSLGILHAANHQIPEAQQEFERAVALDPASTAARNDLASLFAAQGQSAQAEQVYRDDVKQNPSSSDAVLALANFLTGKKRFAEAEPLFQQWTEMQHNTAQAQFRLASFYTVEGKNDRAIAQDQAIAKKFPTFNSARLQWAQLEARNKNYAEADRVVGDLLKDQPDNMTALLLQANLQLDQNQPAKALTTLTAAQRLNPNVAQVSYEQGQAYLQENDHQRAQDSFLQAIKIDPNLYGAQAALAELMQAAGNAQSALVYAQKMETLAPNLPEGYLAAGNAQVILHQLPQAEASFQRYIALTPGNSEGSSRLAYVYMMEKRTSDADRLFEQALKTNPADTGALTGLVTLYENSGRAGETGARVMQQMALAQQRNAPASSLAIMNDLLSRYYVQRKDLAKGEATLKLALSQDPKNFNTYVLLGELYAQEKAFPQAQEQFAGAVKANPNSPGLWTLLGMLDEQLNKGSDAEQAYAKALALDPNNGIANNNLASRYSDEPNKLDQALVLAQRAKRALPTVPNVNDTLGWIYVNQSVYQLAIPLLQQAVSAQPTSTDFRVHLATALYRDGQKDAARTQLEAAIKLNQGLAKQADIQQMLKN